MAKTKYTYDIDSIELTRCSSGDMDNSVYYSYFNSNIKAKGEYLKSLLKTKSAMSIIVHVIFSTEINADSFRNICTALTFYDAVSNLTGVSTEANSVDDLFFALMVNYNHSKGKCPNNIRSYGALNDIHNSFESVDGGKLDYREYIISNKSGGQFENEYLQLLLSNKMYSCKMAIKLPIVKSRFGRFRFATDRIPAILTFVGSDIVAVVPPHIWLEMIKEGMNNRYLASFSKMESRNLSKIVDADELYIDDILAQNNFRCVFSFINAYEIATGLYGDIVIRNSNNLPELPNKHQFNWEKNRSNSSELVANDFYTAKISASTVYILQQ